MMSAWKWAENQAPLPHSPDPGSPNSNVPPTESLIGIFMTKKQGQTAELIYQ